MARRKTMKEGLYSFDTGNGTVQGISSELQQFIEFEPIVAPISKKRGLNKEDERPRFSLNRDGETYVFGVNDVFEHGDRHARRRLNSLERTADADYFMLMDVLFLEAFRQHRGEHHYLSPRGVISLPVALYNQPDTVEEIEATLEGNREIADYDNCVLSLKIDPDRLTILPESAGAMFHYAFDPDTLKKRQNVAVAGSTLVVDVGYLTTDISYFEGMKFIRDGAFTIESGIGDIAEALTEAVRGEVRGADVSRVDVAMRSIAGARSGDKKYIEVAPGSLINVGTEYDNALAQLGRSIAQRIQTVFGDQATRVLLAGGGAYHLRNVFPEMMAAIGSPVEICPDPERANVYGAFTGLQLKMQRES